MTIAIILFLNTSSALVVKGITYKTPAHSATRFPPLYQWKGKGRIILKQAEIIDGIIR